MDKKLMAFCKEIVPRRAASVALVVIGKDDSGNADELENMLKGNGVEIVGKCGIACKKGLFSAGKLTDADFDPKKYACKCGTYHGTQQNAQRFIPQ